MTEEYFDIVDQRNEIIGQERRSVVHRTGLWHRGVHVFIFTPDNKLLIQQRAPRQDTFPGAWDCSVSEHLKVAETYSAAAQRGLWEELGLEPLPLQRRLAFKLVYGPNDNEFSELYWGSLPAGIIPVPGDEIAALAYSPMSELKQAVANSTQTFTPWFVELLRWLLRQPTAIEVSWHAENDTLPR